MQFSFSGLLLNTFISALLCGAASAQQAASEAGKLVSSEGPLGSVLVIRGAQTYALQPGDILFAGDRVLTRSNGKAMLTANGCEVSLEPSATVTVDEGICDVAPVVLAESSPAPAGTPTTPAAGIGETGATPGLIGLLVAGGAAGAAGAAGAFNSRTPGFTQ